MNKLQTMAYQRPLSNHHGAPAFVDLIEGLRVGLSINK